MLFNLAQKLRDYDAMKNNQKKDYQCQVSILRQFPLKNNFVNTFLIDNIANSVKAVD